MLNHKWPVLAGIFIIIWIGVIFYFSSQPSVESHEQSGQVVGLYEKANAIFDFSDSQFFNRIESFIFEHILDNKYKTADAKVRKSAHFGIYFVLGVASTGFAYVYSKKWLMGILLGITLPTTVAVIDEFNQGLIDRTSSLNDVVLDFAGASFGMLIALIIIKTIQVVIANKKDQP